MRWEVQVALAVCLAAGLAAGCTTPAETTPVSGTTEISVDPHDFLGAVPCAELLGAVRSYVATVTDETTGFTLPSSAPIACSQRATFRFVVVGHRYTAEIDGYDLPPEAITPIGGPSSGSRHMRATDATKQPLSPRWRSACVPHGSTGAQPDTLGATALQNVDVVVGDCTPFESGVPGETAILVDPGSTLVDLRCADDQGGGVVSFDVVPEGLPAALGLACGTFDTCPGPTCYTGVTPGAQYRFAIRGYDANGYAAWGAICFAVAKAGLTVPAVCGPLSDRGAVRIAITALLAAAGKDCPEDVAAYQACEPSCAQPGSLTSGILSCAEDLWIDDLAAGPHLFEIIGRSADQPAPDAGLAPPALDATCSAVVSPGVTSQASCTLL